MNYKKAHKIVCLLEDGGRVSGMHDGGIELESENGEEHLDVSNEDLLDLADSYLMENEKNNKK